MYYNLKDILQTLLKNKKLKNYKKEIADLLTPASMLSEKKPVLFYVHKQNYDIFIDEVRLSKILDNLSSSYNTLLTKDSFSSLFYKDEYFHSFEVNRYKDYVAEYENLVLDLNNKILQKNNEIESAMIKKSEDNKKSRISKLFPRYKENEKIVVLQFEKKKGIGLKARSFGLTIIENGKTESYFYKVVHQHEDISRNCYQEHPYIQGSGYFIDDDATITTIRNHLKNSSYLMSYGLTDTLDMFASYEYDIKQNNNLQFFDLNDIQRPSVYIARRRNTFLTLLHHFKVEYDNVVNMGNKAIYLSEIVKILNESP
jgi:hypothetical protein